MSADCFVLSSVPSDASTDFAETVDDLTADSSVSISLSLPFIESSASLEAFVSRVSLFPNKSDDCFVLTVSSDSIAFTRTVDDLFSSSSPPSATGTSRGEEFFSNMSADCFVLSSVPSDASTDFAGTVDDLTADPSVSICLSLSFIESASLEALVL